MPQPYCRLTQDPQNPCCQVPECKFIPHNPQIEGERTTPSVQGSKFKIGSRLLYAGLFLPQNLFHISVSIQFVQMYEKIYKNKIFSHWKRYEKKPQYVTSLTNTESNFHGLKIYYCFIRIWFEIHWLAFISYEYWLWFMDYVNLRSERYNSK